jgi:hypothetical protein
MPQAVWSVLGMGIRMAQDLGIHRKVVYSSKPNVQEEQWKRAFWYGCLTPSVRLALNHDVRFLVTMDRWISMGLGRPAAMQSEEYVRVASVLPSLSST